MPLLWLAPYHAEALRFLAVEGEEGSQKKRKRTALHVPEWMQRRLESIRGHPDVSGDRFYDGAMTKSQNGGRYEKYMNGTEKGPPMELHTLVEVQPGKCHAPCGIFSEMLICWHQHLGLASDAHTFNITSRHFPVKGPERILMRASAFSSEVVAVGDRSTLFFYSADFACGNGREILMRSPTAAGGLQQRLGDLCDPQEIVRIPVLMVPGALLQLIMAGQLDEVLVLARFYCSDRMLKIPKRINTYKPFFTDWPPRAWMDNIVHNTLLQHVSGIEPDMTARALRQIARDFQALVPQIRLAQTANEDEDGLERDRTDELNAVRHIASLQYWADRLDKEETDVKESAPGGGWQYDSEKLLASVRFGRCLRNTIAVMPGVEKSCSRVANAFLFQDNIKEKRRVRFDCTSESVLDRPCLGANEAG